MEPIYDEDEERFIPRTENTYEINNLNIGESSSLRKLLIDPAATLWQKFKQYLAEKNPGLDIDKVLEKNSMKKEPIISYGVIEIVIRPPSKILRQSPIQNQISDIPTITSDEKEKKSEKEKNSPSPPPIVNYLSALKTSPKPIISTVTDRNDNMLMAGAHRIMGPGVTDNSNGSILYHVFRRRNTLEFDTAIRSFASKNQLYEMICLLSKDERDRIMNNTFDDIWDDYFIDHKEGNHVKLRSQSYKRFQELKDLVTIASQPEYSECLPITVRPYIFAKGRSNKGENPLDAALREAAEETKVSYDKKDLYFQSPITSHLLGSDGNRYIEQYYVIKRDYVYSSPTQYLGSVTRYSSSFTDINYTIDYKSMPRETYVERLRPITISHELESDAWISIPIFKSRKDHLEWKNNVQPYKEYGMFKRNFDAILQVHSHMC